MKGYKVFNSDWTCRGFQFEVGKTYEMNESPVACKRGFHFCTQANDCFNYYDFNSNNKVAEVVAHGECVTHRNDSKVATNKIEIVKELTWHEVLELVNVGKNNTGRMNTGDSNTGNWNTGDRNTGDWNTGDWNTGDSNTGNWNTGNSNTGDRNTGDWNTGDSNTGDSNTGNWNTGNWNTGNSNTGDRNTGDWNTGNWNTGDRNTGFANACNYQTGAFNTEESNIILFNKEFNMTPTSFYESEYYDAIVQGGFDLTNWICEDDMSELEKEKNPTYKTTGGYLKRIGYKEAWANNWANKSEENKQIVLNIPNFDADIFYEITGIDVR